MRDRTMRDPSVLLRIFISKLFQYAKKNGKFPFEIFLKNKPIDFILSFEAKRSLQKKLV